MKTQEQKTFQRDLLISLALHLIFVLIFIYGVPSFDKLPEDTQVITFEMLPVSDVVNVKNQDPKKSEQKEIKESQKIEKSARAPKEEVKQPEEKPIEKPTEQKKEAEIIPEKEKKKEKEKEKEKKPTPPKKVKEQQKPKKPEPQKKPVKKQEDVIDSILQNLEDESEGEKKNSINRTTSSQENEGKFARGNNDEDSPLSITEKMLIKKQIEDNWTQIVGDLEGIKVKIHLELNVDGSLIKAQIIGVTCPLGKTELCQLVSETTERAVKKLVRYKI